MSQGPNQNWKNFLQVIYDKYHLDPKETWFVNVYNGIGDAFWIAGFLKEFKTTFNVKTLFVVAREGLREIVELYKHCYDHVIFLDRDFPIDKN